MQSPRLLEVSAEEAGQKLLNFLQRCLINDNSELHRWIRSGQVRINSARTKAFDRVQEGDMVRVPPFAVQKENTIFTHSKREKAALNASQFLEYRLAGQEKKIKKVYENEHILVVNKPYNLPCQGGTGHHVHLAQILKDAYPHARFTPAPTHRLDKHSTGLVLIGKSYKGLRFLSDFMQEENKPFASDFAPNPPCKEYWAWVHGDFEKIYGKNSFYMVHYLHNKEELGRMHAMTLKDVCQIGVLENSNIDVLKNSDCALSVFRNLDAVNNATKDLRQGVLFREDLNTSLLSKIANLPYSLTLKDNTQLKIAFSLVKCLRKQEDFSLLNVGIFTGRKHQIRVQCAHLGLPLVGDGKYGIKSANMLKLHAYRIRFPESADSITPKELTVLPDWDKFFSIDCLQ